MPIKIALKTGDNLVMKDVNIDEFYTTWAKQSMQGVQFLRIKDLIVSQAEVLYVIEVP